MYLKTARICIVVIVFVLLVGCSVRIEDKEPIENDSSATLENYYGNTTGNSANGGYYTIQGDWIYHKNYKIKTDGTHKTQYTTDNAVCVNVVGDWVYYCKWTDETIGRLCRIRADGSDKMEYDVGDISYHNLIVAGEWIYYSDKWGNLYKVNVDGTQRLKMGDVITYNFQVSGDWVYYLDNSDIDTVFRLDNQSLYRFQTDSTQKELLCENIYDTFQVVDNYIYYSDDERSGFYRMSIEGREKTLISTRNIRQFNIYKDWIYFVDSSARYESDMIFRMKMDATSCKEIADGYKYSSLNIVNDWIYFYGYTEMQKVKVTGSRWKKADI